MYVPADAFLSVSTRKFVTNDWVPDDAQYDDSAAVALVAPVVGSRLQTQKCHQDNVGDVTMSCKRDGRLET